MSAAFCPRGGEHLPGGVAPSGALQRVDHIVVLRDGRIESEGKLEDLLTTSAEMRRLWEGDFQ